MPTLERGEFLSPFPLLQKVTLRKALIQARCRRSGSTFRLPSDAIFRTMPDIRDHFFGILLEN